MDPRAMGRWAPAIVAGVVFGVVGIAAAYGGGGGHSGAKAQDTSPVPYQEQPSTSFDPLSTETQDSVADVSVVPGETTIPKIPLTRTLSKGMGGKDVKRMQQRLVDLGYDPGNVDGIFGLKTVQAVWAFEKLVMNVPATEVKGKVTPAMWDRMQDDIVIKPKRPNGTRTHLEVYLPQQVAILFVNSKVRLITHISSGTGEPWQAEVTIDPGEDGNENGTEPVQALVSGVATTPGGVYKFYRRYVDPATNGWREGRLGRMYKPVYFNFGLAVHGSGNVPSHPASHGCIRIPMHIADYFPDLVKNGDQVFVFDGKKSPEAYGAQHPVWDQVDVQTVPTTSTTEVTTTKPPKTTTTAKPSTTKKTTTTADPTATA